MYVEQDTKEFLIENIISNNSNFRHNSDYKINLNNYLVKLKIKEIWEEIVGKFINDKCDIFLDDFGNLNVQTDIPAIKTELTLRKNQILIEINERANQEIIKKIDIY